MRKCFKPAEEPQDAEVREAVERLENSEYTIALDGSQDDTPQMWADIDVLIAYVRAVQAPRLTGERLEAVKESVTVHERRADWPQANRLRAAFPEAFGKEG